MNLLSYGVEGVHYKKLDNGFITYVGKEKKNHFLIMHGTCQTVYYLCMGGK